MENDIFFTNIPIALMETRVLSLKFKIKKKYSHLIINDKICSSYKYPISSWKENHDLAILGENLVEIFPNREFKPFNYTL